MGRQKARPVITLHDMDGASQGSSTPVLLYDGECGFCARSVQFVLSHEPATRQERLRFAPLQGAFGAQVRAEHPELAGIDSVVWYEPGTNGHSSFRVRSDAGLMTLQHVGGAWALLAGVGRLAPRVFRDAVYDFIARHRLDLTAPACLLPTAAQRRRFLP
jgi:predicted DCC family thiol-disulfide oxidoreductase YuxK